MRTTRLLTMLGVGCVTAAVLAAEIALTRVFSVTLWYHFAFLVISLALLGSGAAGVWLYLLPRPFAGARAPRALPWLALAAALALLAAFALYMQLPLTVNNLRDGLDLADAGWLLLTYALLTVPFIFAGAAVALALRHYQAQAGRLYFADLAGASLGCLLSVVAITAFGGAGAVLAAAAVCALGAFLFALDAGARRARLASGGALALAALGLALHAVSPWFTLVPRQTYNNDTPIFEQWNAFSRITLYNDNWPIPFGWGISQTYFVDPPPDPGHLMIMIDEKAGTPIQRHTVTAAGDDWDAVDFLTYDVTALPYYLRAAPDVFVIGPGGGRDVLTALRFGAAHITGVELNPIIVELVQQQHADYAGHIYDRPNVAVHVDDARTYLAARPDTFDIIQASLIDTFAATSAGAFALSENGIYTVEAFESYYDHLNDDGLVNFSRWYYANGPAETLRLVAVGLQAWENRGVTDAAQHVVVLANLTPDRIADEGLAGMLLKKTPFTPAELAIIQQQADRLDFAVLYAPGVSGPDASPVADFVLAADRDAFISAYPVDISPSTDNRPFFFNVVRLGDLGSDTFAGSAIYGFGAEATRTLIVTLVIALLLAALLIVLPLALGRGAALRGAGGGPYIAYYALLGLGFIMVEIPMLQKMSLYLGSPTYALVVILFALLLFSGLGSLWSQRVPVGGILRSLRLTIALLLLLIGAYALLLPRLLAATQGLPLLARALLAVLALAPAGLLMGRPFPLGLRYAAAAGADELMPWLWAANGTLSVVGSVTATIMAINYGFAAVFAAGALAYALALLATLRFGRWQAAAVSAPRAGRP